MSAPTETLLAKTNMERPFVHTKGSAGSNQGTEGSRQRKRDIIAGVNHASSPDIEEQRYNHGP